jgi:hypothetical protein
MPRNNENSIPVANFAIEGYVAIESRCGVTSELVQREENHNIVVNLGLNDIAKLVGNHTPSGGKPPWSPTRGAIGTGTANAAATDTSLTLTSANQFSGALTAAYTAVAGGFSQLRYTWTYAVGSDGTLPNGATYAEVGLCLNNSTTFDADGEYSSGSDNILFCRAKHGAIAKTTDVTLSYTYDLRFKTAS